MSDPKVEIISEPDHPTDETFPRIPKALITRLKALYPDACPTLSMKDREIWFRVGQVDVVRRLIVEYDRQKESNR